MANEADNTSDLLANLPSWMPTAHDTGNYKLLDVAGRSLDDLDNDVNALDNATTIQHAESVDQIRLLAKLIDLPPKDGESKEKYRARTIANYQLNTSEGTAGQLIENVATILDISNSNIEYKQSINGENGFIEVQVPLSSLNDLTLSEAEFVSIIGDHIPAGYRIRAQTLGTYTYLGTSAYSGPFDSGNGGYDSTKLNSDSTKGHDGLDANGDPKDNGGTYSGIIGS